MLSLVPLVDWVCSKVVFNPSPLRIGHYRNNNFDSMGSIIIVSNEKDCPIMTLSLFFVFWGVKDFVIKSLNVRMGCYNIQYSDVI